LFDSSVPRVLLVAGSLDGGGKVGAGLSKLANDWNEQRKSGGIDLQAAEYAVIEGAGHLPMVDETEKFADILLKFLSSIR
jgi:pimeloyl-ACP methyl ester carboxylesterase